MLKKKSKGVMSHSKCERCGEKFKVLYNSTSGKKICEDCLFTEQCLISALLEENEKK